jgi:hypothetical protein
MEIATMHSTTAARNPAMTALWIWFALGALAFACVPALRTRDPFWGWLPFWLLAAPLLDLAVLHRCRLAATSRALLVRVRRSRRPARRQATRLRTRRVLRTGVRSFANP